MIIAIACIIFLILTILLTSDTYGYYYDSQNEELTDAIKKYSPHLKNEKYDI